MRAPIQSFLGRRFQQRPWLLQIEPQHRDDGAPPGCWPSPASPARTAPPLVIELVALQQCSAAERQPQALLVPRPGRLVGQLRQPLMRHPPAHLVHVHRSRLAIAMSRGANVCCCCCCCSSAVALSSMSRIASGATSPLSCASSASSSRSPGSPSDDPAVGLQTAGHDTAMAAPGCSARSPARHIGPVPKRPP